MKSSARGFTLIELMVGLVIGLIAILAMMNVMINAEEQKRSTTSGMDAQVNGALALTTLVRDIVKAGYGFTSARPIIGCLLQNRYQGGAMVGMPTNLVPLVITANANGGVSDTIQSIASDKKSFSIPIWLGAPYYTPGATSVNVASVRGLRGPIKDISGNVIETGNLMVAASYNNVAMVAADLPAKKPCQIFELTADPAGGQVIRNDTANWNPTGYPNVTYDATGNDTPVFINLGGLNDVTYSISATNDLVQRSFTLAVNGTASYQTVTLNNNIVQLKALYGKDTNADGAVDTWDTVTPTTNAGWLQVLAVRVAILARSGQKEKDPVTFDNPSWDVGAADVITPAAGDSIAACGTSRCIPLKIKTLTDWNYYRYKLFETTVPLRNMLWYS
jgi:type IV pilus assembly protein PilW